MPHTTLLLTLALATTPALVSAQGELSADQVQKLVHGSAKSVVTDAAIIDAVKAQNDKTKTLGQAQIDALDNEWKAEFKTAGTGKLISSVVDNDVSDALRKFKDANSDLVREVFVMDAKGLNVGAAEPTSDYWQGDEDKWKKTFAVGPDAVFADKIKFDESSGQSQAQVSVTIKDPQSGQAIGAVTFGVNVGALK